MQWETILSISEARSKGLSIVAQEWGHESGWWLFVKDVAEVLGINRVGEIPNPDDYWGDEELEVILACEAPEKGLIGLQARDGWGGVNVVLLRPITGLEAEELEKLCGDWEDALLEAAPRDSEGGIYPSHLPISVSLFLARE